MALVQVVAWKITCGRPDGCGSVLLADAPPDEAAACEAARERGWDVDDETGRIRCPKHRGEPDPEPAQAEPEQAAEPVS